MKTTLTDPGVLAAAERVILALADLHAALLDAEARDTLTADVGATPDEARKMARHVADRRLLREAGRLARRFVDIGGGK